MIPNHVAATLSNLDLQIAAAVPPGGNWRNIPDSVPSKRLAQIRSSAAAGEGSRSTYYGRLHPDRPAYTVNTYYNRPGNGCFLHYDVAGGQHRTLSHREAARLQSFPDNFIFQGSQRAICQQIGNAVPPLLAFQVARALGTPGIMIDVFAGAGGLSLGFHWAGWATVSAVDSDANAVAAFNANVAPLAFVGDMNDEAVHARLIKTVADHQRTNRLALVGGPPCQGFSTGGKRRSPDDARNLLHARYADLLAELRPDVFVFENVLGLLSLEGGRFAAAILDGLRRAGYDVVMWRLNAAHYGVPQRRERVFIVGTRSGIALPHRPPPITVQTQGGLFSFSTTCSVRDALTDLPALVAGQDGSALPYRTGPKTRYQQLMRGLLTPASYLAGVGEQNDSIRQSGTISGFVDGIAAVHG